MTATQAEPISPADLTKLVRAVERLTAGMIEVVNMQKRFTPYVSYLDKEGNRIIMDMRCFSKVRVDKGSIVHLYPINGGNNQHLDHYESLQVSKTLETFAPSMVAEVK